VTVNIDLRRLTLGPMAGPAFLAILLTLSTILPVAPAQKNEKPVLADILKKAAEYCRKLESASLYYVCEEDISEKIYIGTRPAMGPASVSERRFNTWTYDYQLIRNGPTLDERRKLLKKNGTTMDAPDAQLETRRFSHKFVVFGPVGLLSARSQGGFLYELIKEERVNKAKAYVVDAKPGASALPNALYGRVWLKGDDASVLKIEWDQRSMENFPEIQRTAAGMDREPQIEFISEYAFEKRGLRFPSRYTVQENYVKRNVSLPVILSATTVLYKNYRFFTVEVDVKD
jgi:hypothetical protein